MTSLIHYVSFRFRFFNLNISTCKYFCRIDKSDEFNKKSHSDDIITNDEIELPEEPTTCCMSGCANCVWINYAEEITSIFNDNGENAKRVILEKIKDPNMKAFLLTEMKTKLEQQN